MIEKNERKFRVIKEIKDFDNMKDMKKGEIFSEDDDINEIDLYRWLAYEVTYPYEYIREITPAEEILRKIIEKPYHSYILEIGNKINYRQEKVDIYITKEEHKLLKKIMGEENE